MGVLLKEFCTVKTARYLGRQKLPSAKSPLNVRGTPNGALPDYGCGITAAFHGGPLALQL
ncbi:hypothetical protein RAD16_23220 [Bradyrhizobium sp. 18BD]